jgi:PleD family two-component response regulator
MALRIVPLDTEAISALLGTTGRRRVSQTIPRQLMGDGTHRGRTPTVLVVDDEPLICSLASDSLRDAGYRTLEAHNARQAIDLLEKGEHVDAVFSDVQMPGMDGFELQRWLRQHRPWRTSKRPADTWDRRVGFCSSLIMGPIWNSGFGR